MRWRFYYLIQVFVALGVMLPLHWLGKLLNQLHPFALEHRISRGPYYWAVVRKRQALGEPEWKEIDAMLGIPNPDWEPPKLSAIDGLPQISMCPGCGDQPLINNEAHCNGCRIADLEDRIANLEKGRAA